MYRITDKKFHTSQYGREKYLDNWPMLYILENKKSAYIGESTNVAKRMRQHKADREKEKFETVHFIFSDEFNQSVTFDYESKLIQLFAADQQYILTNGNDGIADKNYYNKEYYDSRFERLWERLRAKRLAKHPIDTIVNSDLFKYSPYKELNESQEKAVKEIFRRICAGENRPIVVNGMPGSGKTIVAVYLFKYLRDYTDENGRQPFSDKKMALVIPQTSLRKTLRELFKHIYGLKASDVIGPSDIAKGEYDIALVDEAHRLHRRKNITNYRAHDENNRKLGLPADATELDWILRRVKCPVLFYDENQVVGPSGIPKQIFSDRLNAAYNNRMISYYTLRTQMRVRGGNDYIDYVRGLLNNTVRGKKTFDTYEFKLVNQFSGFERLLMEKESSRGLSRMIAGYAWPWISKRDKSLKDIEIEGHSKMWNNRTENWVHSDGAVNEVGCIHSIQGYDLNYAFVILGNDIRYDETRGVTAIDPDNYYDRNGKASAGGEELFWYIKNIYYVLMTRGVEGTYLYVCDPSLRRYLSNYIDVIG